LPVFLFCERILRYVNLNTAALFSAKLFIAERRESAQKIHAHTDRLRHTDRALSWLHDRGGDLLADTLFRRKGLFASLTNVAASFIVSRFGLERLIP
jgi:hypothetical protein